MQEEQRSWDRLLNFEVPICVGSLHFRAQSLTVKSESEALQDRHARGSSMLLVNHRHCWRTPDADDIFHVCTHVMIRMTERSAPPIADG